MWKLRSVLFSAPAIVVCTAIMGCLSMVVSLWDPTGNSQHRVMRVWARMLLRLGGIRCRVYGAEKLNPARAYVLVSNHTSYIDTPAVTSSIPLQFRFFAKKGLFSVPFIGWHLTRAGHLPVIRGDARASLKSLSEGAKLIRERNLSVLIFPEGGRTETGLRQFKEGAAYIAIKAGVPAVPVALVNTRKALPMHSMMVQPCEIEIHLGDPIETSAMTLQDRGRLNEMLYERVGEMTGESLATTGQER